MAIYFNRARFGENMRMRLIPLYQDLSEEIYAWSITDRQTDLFFRQINISKEFSIAANHQIQKLYFVIIIKQSYALRRRGIKV